MRETLSLGPSPYAETCAQVGSTEYDYATRARIACKAFVAQLRRVFGKEPEGATFRITRNAHDFGTYYDVVVSYDEASPEAREFAYMVERGIPDYWDETAKAALADASLEGS